MSRNKIMAGIIVACLVLAGIMTYVNRPQKPPAGIEGIDPNEMIWVKCKDPNCGAEYQMGEKDYLQYIQEHVDLKTMKTPLLVCNVCGKKTIYKATKCEKCGEIFFYGEAPNDFPDRCPKCNFSAIENAGK